jgi:uncharacterized protein
LSRKLITTKDIHRGYTLVYNLRCGTIRRCSSRFWRALRFENRWGGYVAWRPELNELIKDKVLVDMDADEQKQTLEDKIHTIASCMTDQLYWTIWPTTDCNLACDYCGQTHANLKLSRAHCDLTVQVIQRRLKTHGFKKLHVGWFGGEPLLGLDVMRYLTPQLFKTAKELGIKYDARLVTNGTLMTRAVAQELIQQLGVVWVEVTLDGPREIHDVRRVTKGGSGTYDRILQNVRDFLDVRGSKREVALTLRCNVDCRNADTLKRFVDELAGLNLQKEVGRINFAGIYPWGETPGQRHRYIQQQYARIQLDLAEYAMSKGFGTWYLPLGGATGCQASALDTTLNVVPGGRLYRCSEVPLVPMYEKQRDYQWWDRGTLEELLARKEEDIVFSSGWYEELAQGKWPCTGCKFFGVCAGECPKQMRDGHKSCPLYICNLPKRMRLYSRLRLPVPKEAKAPSRLTTMVKRILGVRASSKEAEAPTPGE